MPKRPAVHRNESHEHRLSGRLRQLPGPELRHRWHVPDKVGRCGQRERSVPHRVPRSVDTSGAVYVSDVGNCRVQKSDSAGKYLTQWGSSGSGNGQFAYSPQGPVAVTTRGVWVR